METLVHVGLMNAALAAALAAVVAVACLLIRNPALKHALWLLVLLKLITPPLVNVPVLQPFGMSPHVDVAASNSVEAVPPAAMVNKDRPPISLDAPPVLVEKAVPAEAQTATIQPPNVAWEWPVAAAWLIGSLGWWSLVAFRIGRLQRLLRLAAPAPTSVQEQVGELSRRLGVKNPPHALLVPGPVSPMLWGLGLQPRLLLPADLWPRLTADEQTTLLLHELVHLKRRDHWVRRLELLVLGLYWWNPIAWWARREIQQAEEMCCDSWVVSTAPESAAGYAQALLKTVTFLSEPRRVLAVGASGAGHVRGLKRRLAMILSGTFPKKPARVGVLVALLLAVLVLPWALGWAQPAPPAATEVAAAAEPEKPAELVPPAPRNDSLQDAEDEVELLKIQRDAKQAELLEAKALLEKSKRNFQRMKTLKASQAVDQQVVESAEADVAVHEARLAGKQAQLREVELRLRIAERKLAKLRKAEKKEPSEKEAALFSEWANGLFRSEWANGLFKERVKDFGTVSRGTVLTHYFRFTNRYSMPLHFVNIRTSSGALSAKALPEEILPNQEGVIRVKVDTSRFLGGKEMQVYLSVDVGTAYFSRAQLAVHANSADDAETKKQTIPKRPPVECQIMNQRNFPIPLSIDPAHRPRIKEMILFVSRDQGRTWTKSGVATPERDRFDFHAPSDGVYWFNLAIVDKDGKQEPADIATAPPAMKVLVDTEN